MRFVHFYVYVLCLRAAQITFLSCEQSTNDLSCKDNKILTKMEDVT